MSALIDDTRIQKPSCNFFASKDSSCECFHHLIPNLIPSSPPIESGPKPFGLQEKQSPLATRRFTHEEGPFTGEQRAQIRDYFQQPAVEASNILQKPINRGDLFSLFFSIMALFITDMFQKRQGRQHERDLELSHMQKVVDEFKEQGKWHIIASVGSGVLKVFAAIIPIVGYTKGEWIMEKLKGNFKSFDGMDEKMFFKQTSDMLRTMGEINQSTGQIHQAYSDGNRVHDQNLSELKKMNMEEFTRLVDEIVRELNAFVQFLQSLLSMESDATRAITSSAR